MTEKTQRKKEVLGLLGVGLDNDDGEKRITRAEDILVVGGSLTTHSRMQDIVVQFTESLRIRGKRLRDASPDEVADLLSRAMER